MFFAGYLLTKLLVKNASEAKTLRGVNFTRETIVRQSQKFLLEFCVFMFCLNPFSQEELSYKLLAKMPLKEFSMKIMKNAI